MSEKPSRSPQILTVTLANANTEYEQLFPNGIKRFSMTCRSNNDVRFSYETNKVATPTEPYVLLEQGVSYSEDDVSLNSKKIFLASSVAGVVVELIIWK